MNMNNENNGTWETPKELLDDKSLLVDFPIECLPTTIRNYVVAVAEHTQTDVDMSAVSVLGLLAICNQKKYVVEALNQYTEPLNLYTVFIAGPGERKSSVLTKFTDVLYDFEDAQNVLLQNEIAKNTIQREMLEVDIKKLKSKASKSNGEMFKQELISKTEELQNLSEINYLRLVGDDCSAEALTSLLNEQKGKMAIVSAEGGIFDIMAGRYSKKPNIDVFLKGHSGDNISVDRKGSSSQIINHPALTFILAIQPSILIEVMENNTMTGRGLFARFLYSTPKSKIGERNFIDRPIPNNVKSEFESLITSLLLKSQTDKPIKLKLSVDGLELIKNYFDEVEVLLKEEIVMREWLSKYIGAILRIAGNLHLALDDDKKDEPISATTIKNSIAIGKYFLSQSKYIHSIAGADEEIKKAKYIISKLPKEKEISRRTLLRSCTKKLIKNVDELIPTLDLLEDYGYIKQTQRFSSPNSTKASEIILINPTLFKNDAVEK